MDENSSNVTTQFLSMEEISKILNISRYSVAQSIARGDLNCVKIGKIVRISQASFREFLDKNAYPKSNSAPLWMSLDNEI